MLQADLHTVWVIVSIHFVKVHENYTFTILYYDDYYILTFEHFNSLSVFNEFLSTVGFFIGFSTLLLIMCIYNTTLQQVYSSDTYVLLSKLCPYFQLSEHVFSCTSHF